jgi:hypothetical protein
MKVGILRVGNPLSAQKPLKDTFHGTGRQQGNLLGIYPQVSGAGAAGEHIPMGRGQEKTGFTVVAPNQFHDSPAHHDPQPLTHIPVVQVRIRADLRQRAGSLSGIHDIEKPGPVPQPHGQVQGSIVEDIDHLFLKGSGIVMHD